MAIDRAFAAAYIDNENRHRILGRRLRPFSLWHRLLLQAIESPFLGGEQAMLRIFDMREAIGICSLDYPRCRVRRPIFYMMWALLWYGWPRSRWIKFMKKTRDQMVEYFGDYIYRPEYTIKSLVEPRRNATPPPRLGEIPEGFSLLADVIGFLRCTQEYAWNLPIGQAYWLQMAALRHRDQQVDYLSEEEKEFQANKAFRDRMKRGAGNGSV